PDGVRPRAGIRRRAADGGIAARRLGARAWLWRARLSDAARERLSDVSLRSHERRQRAGGDASAALQRAAISSRVAVARATSGRAAFLTLCRSPSSVMYSTGDLPSMRARKSAGSRLAILASIASR